MPEKDYRESAWRTVPHDGEGTLLVRKDARGRETWYGKFSVGGRQVKKALGSDLTERQAKKALATLVVTFKPKAPIKGEPVTVTQAAKAHIDKLEADGAKHSTVHGYRSVARRFKYLDERSRSVDRVRQDDIQGFDSELIERGLSPKTRWQALRLLDATLKYSVKRGWATAVPVIEKPKKPRGRGPVRFLELRELERVLDAYPDDPLGRVMRTLTLTAARTGLRRGELLGLRWGAIDWDQNRVHVDESYVLGRSGTPKSGNGRAVPLPASAARELRALRLATPYSGDGDPVFCHPRGTGKPLDATYVSKAFSVALEASGGPSRTFHGLRHTYAVHAAKAGVKLPALSDWLGHADLATTSIYAKYSPSEGEAELIEQAFAASEVLGKAASRR